MANIEVNKPYEYTAGMLGAFSAGTVVTGTWAPHPVAISETIDASGVTTNNRVTDLSAIVLGGINGLNN
jgi:hypothetical protein